jgi:hypothetical protein
MCCELLNQLIARTLPLRAAFAVVVTCYFGTAHAVALACSCPSGPGAGISWPEDAATDVAMDTPIVVGLYDYNGNPGDMSIHLTDAAGSEVALDQTRRVPQSWNGCGAAEMVFLKPTRMLEAGMTYTVSVSFARETELRKLSTFSVGEDVFVPEKPLDAELTYLKAYTKASCVEDGCDAIAEVRVALDKTPENLLWLVIRSAAQRSGQNHWPFRPDGSRRDFIDGDEGVQTVQRSVLLPNDDDCIDVRIYGREGRALFDQRRCKPDRCASTDSFGLSTCGDPPFTSIDASLVPADSCESATVPHFLQGLIVDLPPGPTKRTEPAASEDLDAGTDEPVTANDADASHSKAKRSKPPALPNGCSALASRRTTAFAFDAFGLLVAGCLLAARRRARISVRRG